MPNGTDSEHLSLWKAIDALKDVATEREVHRARLDGRLEKAVEFIEQVRDGKCPTGQAHTQQIEALQGIAERVKPVIENHKAWTAGKSATLVAVVAALVIGLVNFTSARLASATEDQIRANIIRDLRSAGVIVRPASGYRDKGLDFDAPMRVRKPQASPRK